jgi:hypothetical protein
MMDSVSSRPDEYRRNAMECWELAYDAEEIETKAVFQLAAEAWTMLAAQVQTLEDARSELALESA